MGSRLSESYGAWAPVSSEVLDSMILHATREHIALTLSRSTFTFGSVLFRLSRPELVGV